jgi:hypothetical protein
MVPTPWLSTKPRRHAGTPRDPMYSAIFRTRHWLKVQHGVDPYSRDRVGVKSMTTRAFSIRLSGRSFGVPAPAAAAARGNLAAIVNATPAPRPYEQWSPACFCDQLRSSSCLPVLAGCSHYHSGRIPKIGLCKIDHLIERIEGQTRTCVSIGYVRRCGAFKWVQVPPGERSSWKQSASFPSLPAPFCATSASPPKSCEGRMEISHAIPPRNNTIAATTCAADAKTRWSVHHRHEQFCTDARRWPVQELAGPRLAIDEVLSLPLNNHGCLKVAVSERTRAVTWVFSPIFYPSRAVQVGELWSFAMHKRPYFDTTAGR